MSGLVSYANADGRLARPRMILGLSMNGAGLRLVGEKPY